VVEIKRIEETTPEDYVVLGMKSGLEIHQQLATTKKLFCRCPVVRPYSEEFNAEILRHMRPTLSELGEYDGTALMEFKTKKEIIYQIHQDTICTYEMDDTPPFELNEQALDIALEVTMLLNCNLVSEVHIARKQYLDGSIPTGFQRTTILGVDGWIPFKGRRIGIIQLGLEEDACREVSDVGHLRTYRTDRLGIPLIETVTYPDMKTPQEVAEVGQILRYLARSTGKVHTGMGAARQDVNVSIEGGRRVEIKGVCRIPLIPLLVHNEAYRQAALLDIKRELARRGITPDSFKADTYDVSELVSGTQYYPLAKALKVYNDVATKYPKSTYSAEAYYRTGVIYHERLDSLKLAQEAFGKVAGEYSNSDFAAASLEKSTSMKRLLELQKAAGKGETVDQAAEKRFMAAEIQLTRLGDVQTALAGYQAVLDSFPRTAVAPKAAYAIAWIREYKLNDKDKAIESYRALVDRFPRSYQARGALFQLGFLGADSLKVELQAYVDSARADTTAIEKPAPAAPANPDTAAIVKKNLLPAPSDTVKKGGTP